MEFAFGHVRAEWPGEDKLQNELEQLILETVNEMVITRPPDVAARRKLPKHLRILTQKKNKTILQVRV
jgi:hypothetical protein